MAGADGLLEDDYSNMAIIYSIIGKLLRERNFLQAFFFFLNGKGEKSP